jgi:hypothetical protein
MDSGDKATNKAMSASYKYMAMQLFCIPTEGDNDADATTHEVVARGAVFHPPAATNGNHAPVCDVCGTQGRLGKDGESYFCPKKENHDNKWYTIPSAKAGAANS